MSRDIPAYEAKYLSSNFEDTMVFYRRKKIIDILNSFKPKYVLEIGCGIAPIFEYYSTFTEYTIVEPSEKFVNIAKEKQSKLATNGTINIVHGLLEEKIETLQSFLQYDFIILSGLLHEVVDVNLLLSSITKLMNKNTVLHINVPNANSFHRVLAKESGIIKSVYEKSSNNIKLQQSTIFDLDKLESKIKEHQLKTIEKGSYFIKPFSHNQMYQLLNQNIISLEVLSGLYKMITYLPNNGAEIFINTKLI